MCITARAIRVLFGAVLLSCNDSAHQTPTESLNPSFDVGGNHDMVQGAGTIPGAGSFRVFARSGPLGEDPKGHMEIEFIGPPGPFSTANFKGKVTCLAVLSSSRAVIQMVSEEFPHGMRLIVEDGKGIVPDMANVLANTNLFPCASMNDIVYPMDGDVVVRDALPLP